MTLLSQLFGRSRKAVTRRVAHELHGSLVRAPSGRTVVVSEIEGWETVFDVDTPDGEPNVFFGTPRGTRIGVPFTPRSGFTFDLKRRGLVGQALYDRRTKRPYEEARAQEVPFQEIQPLLTPPTIAFGHGEFDYEFSIETNDERLMRQLVANQGYRQLLQRYRSVHIMVEHNNEWLQSLVRPFPTQTALLYFHQPSVIGDIDRIKSAYHLLTATMERLVALDVAADRSPGLFTRASSTHA